jgi:hypothetical protein
MILLAELAFSNSNLVQRVEKLAEVDEDSTKIVDCRKNATE